MINNTNMVVANKMLRKHKGFTLIEVVIASAIFVFLIILVASGMSFFRRSFLKADASGAQTQQAETFLLTAGSEIREARSISKPDLGKHGNILEFTKLNGDVIRYILSPKGVLYREIVGSKKNKKVVENVSTAYFSRYYTNVVGVELCIGKKSPRQYQVLTSFYGRNIKP